MRHPEWPGSARLHALYQDLEQARAGLRAGREELARLRREAVRRAAGAGDGGPVRLLARQIALLDRRARLLAAQQALAERQMHLLERLVYAREEESLARRLEEEAARRRPDWLELLAWAAPLRRGPSGRARQIGELLAWLEEALPAGPAPARAPGTEWARVVRVPDGDGALLDDGRRVRYLGIDAPEMSRPHPEPYAREARDLNAALVSGREVRLEPDRSDTDLYGRLLRYVWLGDCLVNAELVRQGAAFACPVPPDTRYRALFARLERQARRAGCGLWAAPARPRP